MKVWGEGVLAQPLPTAQLGNEIRVFVSLSLLKSHHKMLLIKANEISRGLNTRRSKQQNCIFNYLGRAFSEGIVCRIQQPLHGANSFCPRSSGPGFHFPPCQPHWAVICSIWYLLRLSSCCQFWALSWNSAAGKGQGWLLQEQQKEVGF